MNSFKDVIDRFRIFRKRFKEVKEWGKIELDVIYDDYGDLVHHVSNREIQYVLDLVNEEAGKSRRKYKLIIKKEDLLKEKVVILNILDHLGGIIATREDYEDKFDYLFKNFIETLSATLEEQTRYYFEQTPPDGVKNRYNCHLTDVTSRLLNDIFNNRVP